MIDEKEVRDQLQNLIWQLRGAGECERCKVQGKTSKAPMVRLAGDLEASICEPCVRQWDDLCDISKEYKELVLAEGEVDALRHLIENGKDLRDELRKGLEIRLDARLKVRELSKKWLAGKE